KLPLTPVVVVATTSPVLTLRTRTEWPLSGRPAVDLATPVMVPGDFAAADVRGVLANTSSDVRTSAINRRMATSRELPLFDHSDWGSRVCDRCALFETDRPPSFFLRRPSARAVGIRLNPDGAVRGISEPPAWLAAMRRVESHGCES